MLPTLGLTFGIIPIIVGYLTCMVELLKIDGCVFEKLIEACSGLRPSLLKIKENKVEFN
jgi:hypothetical protein